MFLSPDEPSCHVSLLVTHRGDDSAKETCSPGNTVLTCIELTAQNFEVAKQGMLLKVRTGNREPEFGNEFIALIRMRSQNG